MSTWVVFLALLVLATVAVVVLAMRRRRSQSLHVKPVVRFEQNDRKD